MDMFKIGDLVVREGGDGPVMTVDDVMEEGGRRWVHIEGDAPNAWSLANCLIVFAA
jgi:uncharacterized protein YodC (DUF2158 family)